MFAWFVCFYFSQPSSQLSRKMACKYDHMTLNVDKCGTIQCSLGRHPPPQLDLTSNGRRVSNLPSMTLLGVTVAPSLSWEHHVESVISKANIRRYFLVVLRRAGVMPAHLVHFYITFIRPILEYAAPVAPGPDATSVTPVGDCSASCPALHLPCPALQTSTANHWSASAC